LGFSIEPETWEAMKAAAQLIATVSGERLAMELGKLMTAPAPSAGFELLRGAGLLPLILPELAAVVGIEQDKQPGDDVFNHTMRALDAARADSVIEHRGDLELLFAVLFHDIGKAKTARYHPPSKRIVFFSHQIVSVKLARRAMERLKLATLGVDTKRIESLIAHHMFETKASFTDRAVRRFVAKVGPDLIEKLLDLRVADNRGGKHPHGVKGVLRLRTRIREEMAKKPPFGAKDLAIDGHDLMAIGVPEGPSIGAILALLVDRVLDEPSENTREQLLAQAAEMKENPEALAAASAALRQRRREEAEEEMSSESSGREHAERAHEAKRGESGPARVQGR